MALYPDITLLSALDYTTPGEDEVICKHDDAIRQFKKFASVFLAVAHNDNGSIKAGAVTSTSFTASSVDSTALGTSVVTAAKLATDAVETLKIKDRQVTTTKIALLGVTNAEIATGTIEHDKIKAGTLTATELGSECVTDAKLAFDSTDPGDDTGRAVGQHHIKALAVTGAKVAANTLAATKLAVGTGTTADPEIPVVCGTGSADSLMAKIRGVLRATLTGGELVFTYATAGAAGSSVNYGRCEEQATGGLTANAAGDALSSWNLRGNWIRDAGDNALLTVSGSTITMVQAGSYLVWMHIPGYSVGVNQAALVVWDGSAYTTVLGTTNVALAPIGQVSQCYFGGVVSIATAGTQLRVLHWAELTRSANGKGVAGVSTVVTPRYAIIEFLKL